MNTPDMFTVNGVKPRRPKRVLMHVVDAGIFPDGENCIQFECGKCGHNTGHIYDTKTLSENKRGTPCPKCNAHSH